MDKENNLLDASQPKAITDSKHSFPKFLEQEEKNKRGLKLYYCLWISRFAIFCATLSLLVFLAASLSLFNLAPKVTVEPFLIINQNSSADMVVTEPITLDMASKEKMMETFVKQYIIYRNTIIGDEIEMTTRWYPGGIINFLSSEKVYNEFYDSFQKEWGKIIQGTINREVEILSINKVGGQKSPVWKVDFKTYDTTNATRRDSGGLNLNVRYWTASVTSFFVPERIFTGRRLINHLGFTVFRYNQTEVNF